MKLNRIGIEKMENQFTQSTHTHTPTPISVDQNFPFENDTICFYFPLQFYCSNQMDTLDRNKINHTKAIEFDHIVHGTIEKLNNMHSKTTTHTASNNSSRCISSNGSNHDNQTKEAARHSSEVNNNNESSSSLIETNAKDFNAHQNGVEQNGCTKTNGYVNGHSNPNRCTIVQNFQNYHKPNR